MGGIGSGRHWRYSNKITTDEMLPLDVRRLQRDKLLSAGKRFEWVWSKNDEPIGKIQITAQENAVTLDYRFQERDGDWESLSYEVVLLSQPCHFKGERRWFACPTRGCGRRVAILYGGRVFACRKCHQLVYPSQREAVYQRAQRKAESLRKRLGWPPGYDSCGSKPKGMHWKTFDRLTHEIEKQERISDLGFAELMFEKYEHLATL